MVEEKKEKVEGEVRTQEELTFDFSKEVKLFGRWSWENIVVRDPSLKPYICLKPVYVPHSCGRHAKKRFGKGKVNIVERLINKIPVTGHLGSKYHLRTSGRNLGKKHKHTMIVYKAFELIEKVTGENPIQVLVRAIENVAPLEDIIIVEYGGIRYPQAVDVSPLRRIDLALRWLAQGAYARSIKSKEPLWYHLAWEIIYAARNDPRSWAIQKRIELERQAAASR